MSRKKPVKKFPYKFGRRDPKRAPAIRFSHIWKGVIPDHPTNVDYAAALSNWQMLGNDQYGDCVAVTWANTTRLVSATLATEEYPNLQQVIDIYKTQNPNFPNDDNGMDIQTLLEYLTKNPGPDGRKVLAFASVDPTNKQEVEAAAAIFGAPWLGFTVRQNNMDEFNSGQPWSYDPSQPVLGGHATCMGGYDDSMGYRFITWGEETSMDLSFITSPDMQEIWVVIYPENLGTKQFIQGIDLQTLAADYQALTGKPLPIPVPPTPTPVPTPTPTPTPTPAPSGCLTAPLAALINWLKSIGL